MIVYFFLTCRPDLVLTDHQFPRHQPPHDSMQYWFENQSVVLQILFQNSSWTVLQPWHSVVTQKLDQRESPCSESWKCQLSSAKQRLCSFSLVLAETSSNASRAQVLSGKTSAYGAFRSFLRFDWTLDLCQTLRLWKFDRSVYSLALPRMVHFCTKSQAGLLMPVLDGSFACLERWACKNNRKSHPLSFKPPLIEQGRQTRWPERGPACRTTCEQTGMYSPLRCGFVSRGKSSDSLTHRTLVG